MLIFPSQLKIERKSTIIVAILLFGLALIAIGIVSLAPRERLRETGKFSVYNSNAKTFREEKIKDFKPQNGDVAGTPIYVSVSERNIVGGSIYVFMGILNLLILVRYWKKSYKQCA